MTKYIIQNKEQTYTYTIECESIQDVRHWIINHLNLSIAWNIKEHKTIQL